MRGLKYPVVKEWWLVGHRLGFTQVWYDFRQGLEQLATSGGALPPLLHFWAFGCFSARVECGEGGWADQVAVIWRVQPNNTILLTVSCGGKPKQFSSPMHSKPWILSTAWHQTIDSVMAQWFKTTQRKWPSFGPNNTTKS